jgi:hypothetical protein
MLPDGLSIFTGAFAPGLARIALQNDSNQATPVTCAGKSYVKKGEIGSGPMCPARASARRLYRACMGFQ